MEEIKNMPELSEDFSGIEELVALLDTPDLIFDKIYPDLKKEMESLYTDPLLKENIKQAKMDSQYLQVVDDLKASLEEINNHEDISANKKELIATILGIFIEEPYDAEISIQVTQTKVPTYAHPTDTGADVYTKQDIKLEALTYGNLIPTGLAVAIPVGWHLSVRPRSGISKNTTLRIANAPGTIDSDYRDEIGILVDNIGSKLVEIKAGERIAQLVLEKNYIIKWKLVENVKEIGEDRQGGFGSTGK